MSLNQVSLENLCRYFFKAVATSPQEMNNVTECSIVATQLEFEFATDQLLNNAIQSHPLRHLLTPNKHPIISTAVANCHDFAWKFKNEVDDKRRNEVLQANLPQGVNRFPYSVGILASRRHVINIAIISGASTEVRIIDSFRNNVRSAGWIDNGLGISAQDKQKFLQIMNGTDDGTNPGFLDLRAVYF
jgi:hypothetical protein